MVRRNIMRLEPEGGFIMLIFFVILSASAALLMLVQASDIECVNPPKAGRSGKLRRSAKSASYPDGHAVGGLR